MVRDAEGEAGEGEGGREERSTFHVCEKERTRHNISKKCKLCESLSEGCTKKQTREKVH